VKYHAPVVNEQEVDLVGRVRASWAEGLPEADTSSIEVLGRIARVAALVNRQLDRLLADADVTRSEFDVLCALARAARPLKASEVTAQTMLSQAATTKVASRLEKVGLIRREKLERDGRVVLIELTDAGRDVVRERFPALMEHEQSLLTGLDDDEVATLGSLLARLTGNVERAV